MQRPKKLSKQQFFAESEEFIFNSYSLINCGDHNKQKHMVLNTFQHSADFLNVQCIPLLVVPCVFTVTCLDCMLTQYISCDVVMDKPVKGLTMTVESFKELL